jgi:prolyl oligopeptidase
MKDAVSVVKQYDYSGKMLQMNCGLGSAGGFSGKKKEETLYILLLITRRRNYLFI